MPAPVQPIIIIKKKVHGHGGHHGGAWKVAYADFVTAMMALFIVLWLLNSNTKVKEAVSGYFKDPQGFNSQKGTGLAGAGPAMNITKEDMKDLEDKLKAAIKKSPEFEKLKDNIEMTITGEGLRIELIENEKGMFFGNGDAKPTVIGRELISKLGVELAKLHNPIMVEGHTDALKYGTDVYTNWELSSDRANSARRILRDSGLIPGRITQVRGFADQQLRFPKDPNDPKNRRVSVIVAYPKEPEPAPVEAKSGHGEVKAEAGHEGKPQGEHEAAKEVAKAAPAHH